MRNFSRNFAAVLSILFVLFSGVWINRGNYEAAAANAVIAIYFKLPFQKGDE